MRERESSVGQFDVREAIVYRDHIIGGRRQKPMLKVAWRRSTVMRIGKV